MHVLLHEGDAGKLVPRMLTNVWGSEVLQTLGALQLASPVPFCRGNVGCWCTSSWPMFVVVKSCRCRGHFR